MMATKVLHGIAMMKNQKEINSPIASVSIGAERKFSFKHKQSKKIILILLEHVSLLLMKDATQKNWLNSLPKSSKIAQPRINLTFRRMVTKVFLVYCSVM